MTSVSIKPIVIANWKMHSSRRESRDFAQLFSSLVSESEKPACDIIICPPVTFISELRDVLYESGIFLGAQDSHQEISGAYTGNISAPMLADIGCSYVILGHSERRSQHFESDNIIARKTSAAVNAGLSVILCVGEDANHRNSGEELEIVSDQLQRSIPLEANQENIVIAYEPLWAIGTGQIPNSSQIQRMIDKIRASARQKMGNDTDKLRVLYGGSVKPENAKEILSISNVNGALVGGSSLSVNDFWKICAHYIENSNWQ